jgi:signal transduction histidine kinase
MPSTLAMYILLTSFILIVLLTAYLLYLGKKRWRLLKKIEALRYHIARDLHDDIGATLSSISFYSQAIRQKLNAGQTADASRIAEQVGVLSRETMDKMNDIVWMVNPHNDSTGKFFERIDEYGSTLFASQQISFLFYADQEVLDIELDMHFRKAYFLVCKEAMNNASKYAGCTAFEVLIKKQGNTITTILKDNGKGFDSQATKSGNGLLNMQVRTESLGGKLVVDTAPGKGTILSFRFPAPPKW